MAYKVSNNAFSTLAGAINSIATSLTVGTGHGDRFPVITGADHTFVTLEDASGNIEIVKVTARASASDVMTIVRAQDGTTARSWAAGDVVECRIIASLLNDAIAHLSDTSDAHAASAITNTPAGNIAATTVQAALNELDTELSAGIATANSNLTAHLNDTSDAHDASAISYAGGTGMSATDVEAAIDELANEKANLAGGTFTGAINEKGFTVAAHATTCDIWTGGNYGTLTGGVVTFTDVADAPVADAWRWIKSNAAHILTDNANIAVQGSANYTLAAGDLMLWHAITTTTFEVYIFPDAGFTIADASTTVKGKVELATTAELQTGTDTTRAVTADAIRQGLIVSGTPIATTSGTSHDFTSIPSWVKRITITLDGVSTNGTSAYLIQLGDSGGIENTGYSGSCSAGAVAGANSNGFRILVTPVAATTHSGIITLIHLGSNVWFEAGNIGFSNNSVCNVSGGTKTLSGTLTTVRLTTDNGTDTFDAGQFNVLYE